MLMVFTKGVPEKINPPLPLLVKTERVMAFLSWFALIKSIFPSPFTSAAATDTGRAAYGIGSEATKPPLPLFVNTVRVLSFPFTQTKSALPSPFTSGAVTPKGLFPTLKEDESTKETCACNWQLKKINPMRVRVFFIDNFIAPDFCGMRGRGSDMDLEVGSPKNRPHRRRCKSGSVHKQLVPD